jgi:hypothetical protein
MSTGTPRKASHMGGRQLRYEQAPAAAAPQAAELQLRNLIPTIPGFAG